MDVGAASAAAGVSGAAFSAEDIADLSARGISVAEANRQLQLLSALPPPIVLDRPCVIGDGVAALSPDAEARAVARGLRVVADGRVTKFVPASGAATRMFQDVIAAHQSERPSATPAGQRFFEQLDALPFAADVRRRAGISGAPGSPAEERALLTTLLDAMRFAELPKGLVPFHASGRPHTAFEDQLREGTGYTTDGRGVSRSHFTVVGQALADFEALLAQVRGEVERDSRCTLHVGFSEQQPSTDTLALDEQGRPFRVASGRLLFRPSGHGALIDNLQALGGDVVVVKNIDNVLPMHATQEVVHWKLVLIGVLADLQQFATDTLASIGAGDMNEADCARVEARLASEFGRVRPASAADRRSRLSFIEWSLNRPIRACGVVRNEGEPGGAPFWVRGSDGSVTSQIVESAQVDAADTSQRAIFAASTHFNPVDIVCGVRDWQGQGFDLSRFVDEGTAFVARKSHEGRSLLALERPGLWNGAMAHWNTVCVEVPGSTFAPVKTVFDLLRPQHR